MSSPPRRQSKRSVTPSAVNSTRSKKSLSARSQPAPAPISDHAKRVPTLGRRFLAWSLEVAILTASVALPFYLGSQANKTFDHTKRDLSPTLQWVQTGTAKALGLSPRSLPTQVTPLTNLLWSAALGLPLILAAGHIYRVGRSGQSWPKQWLGVQVLALNGQMPGWPRTIIRESVGKWGCPLLVAYGVWQLSGAFPVIGMLVGLGAIALIGESLTGLGTRPRRAWHDWLAGTCVVDEDTGAVIHLSSLWHAEAKVPPGLGRSGRWAQAVGPTSVVIKPHPPGWPDSELTLSKVGLGLGLLLTIGGLTGGVSYFLLGRPSTAAATPEENLYVNLVSTLTNPELDPAARRAAVLALGNLPDDRVTPLLVDLIAQTDDLLWLDALQQALVARGAEAFPHLRRLNQGLAADLRMQGEPARHYTTLIRLQTTNRILTKLVMLEEGDRSRPLNLTRMHLGLIHGGDGEFRLVLKNQDLAGIQWQGSVLTQAQLQGARFYSLGADHHPNTYDDRVTNFSGADLSDANLSGADLTLSQLVNAGLLRTNFNRADLTWANLSGANLEHASLIQTVLDQATLANARLSKADLTAAQLSGANLAGARLAAVNAAGSTLIAANLQGISAPAAILTDADLSGANLHSADLTGVTLQGANLSGADLTGASLRDADLRDLRLQGANLNQVDFAGALFTNPTGGADDDFVAAIPDLSMGDQYQGVDFSGGQNLDATQLSFICTQGGLHSACGVSTQE